MRFKFADNNSRDPAARECDIGLESETQREMSDRQTGETRMISRPEDKAADKLLRKGGNPCVQSSHKMIKMNALELFPLWNMVTPVLWAWFWTTGAIPACFHGFSGLYFKIE